jgi:TonB family protein
MRQKQILRKAINSCFSVLMLGIFLSCSHKNYSKSEVDEIAKFPFGQDSLINFLNKNIQWVDGRASGKGYIVVGFTVKKNGELRDIQINKNLFFNSFEKEALRLIQIMPNWTPAKKNNKNVDSKVEVPIKFELN